MNSARAHRGFTLIELMIVTAILVLIVGATWSVISAVMRQDDVLRSRTDLQLDTANALSSMVSLLKQSGASTDASNGNTTYPYIFPIGTPLPGNYGYANTITSTAVTQNTLIQPPNTTVAQGLGPSQGILFRVAMDSDGPASARQMPVNKGQTLTAAMPIEYGNQYHAFMVVYNNVTGVSELQHQVWQMSGGNITPLSANVLARNVSRIMIETSTQPAPQATAPPWPLPSMRAIETKTGESVASYQTATGQNGLLAWCQTSANPTGVLSSSTEIRITLCLAKPSVNNPKNSLNSSYPMSVVWQQGIANMRSQ